MSPAVIPAVRRAPAWAALLLALPLVACSPDEVEQDPGARPGPPGSTPSATSTPAAPEAPASSTPPAAEPLPPVPDARSLPALMREDFTGSRIRYGRVVEETADYTRSEVTYDSGGVTVSGILLRPTGPGPFPGVVLNHGYVNPDVYVTGQGLAREQDWLAREGFAVLHTDYRGHAGSDPAGRLARETRLGYTRDAINAVLALEREPWVDPDRMAMLGRSMGGGVTMNALVVRPDLVEAAVIYASVSSSYLDNLRHFTVPSRPDAVEAIYDELGTPEESPEVYAGLSPRTYFDRISDPVLLHHGNADEICPFPWATETQRLLQRAGVDSRLEVYDGELHAFIPQWQRSIELSVRFLRRQLA